MIKNINLDDQSFESIVENAKKAIRKYAPQWTDENAHDPGITLIELFAWLKEMLQYYMDQTTEPLEYLFLKRFGITRDYGAPSQLFVHLENLKDKVIIEPKHPFRKGKFCFEAKEHYILAPNKIIDLKVCTLGQTKSVFETIKNGLTVYPFSQEAPCGASFIIKINNPLEINTTHHFYIDLYDDYPVKRNPIEDADAFINISHVKYFYLDYWENWVEITSIKDQTFNLIQSGLLTFSIDSEMSDLCLIKGVLEESAYDVPPRIINIYSNVIKLKQAESIESIYLNSNGMPNQIIELPFKDILYDQLEIKVKEDEEVKVWHRVDHLLEASSDENCYAVDTDTHSILFGNNRNGRIPTKGESSIIIDNIERSFGELGNISIDTLYSEVIDQHIECITDARGGRKVSTLDDLKSKLYHQMNDADVAVTQTDYESILRRTPGLMIQKTKCLPMYRPGLTDYPNQLAMNEVSILVVPYGLEQQNKLNIKYIKNLKQQINHHRLITTEVHILNPVYYDITLYLEVNTQRHRATLTEAINQAVYYNSSFEFGQKISKSLLYKELISIDGVINITSMRLDSSRPIVKNKQGDIEIPPNGIGIIKNIEIIWQND